MRWDSNVRQSKRTFVRRRISGAVIRRKQLHKSQMQKNGAQKKKKFISRGSASSETAEQFFKRSKSDSSSNRIQQQQQQQLQTGWSRIWFTWSSNFASHRNADETNRRIYCRGIWLRFWRDSEKFSPKFFEKWRNNCVVQWGKSRCWKQWWLRLEVSCRCCRKDDKRSDRIETNRLHQRNLIDFLRCLSRTLSPLKLLTRPWTIIPSNRF